MPERQTMMEVARLEHAKGVNTPAMPGRGTTVDETEEIDVEAHRRYRMLVGKLMWMISTRLDIAYVVKELARSLQKPTRFDELALKRVLKYVIMTRDYSMHPEMDDLKKPEQLEIMVDASWASAADRKSTSGGIVRLQGFVLGWWSRTQQVVAQSTYEAELLAMNLGACEGRYIQQLLGEMNIETKIILMSDSQSACRTTVKRGPGRMRHLDIKELWLQGEVRDGHIEVKHVPGETNPADLLTKQLPQKKLNQMMELVGMRPSEP